MIFLIQGFQDILYGPVLNYHVLTVVVLPFSVLPRPFYLRIGDSPRTNDSKNDPHPFRSCSFQQVLNSMHLSPLSCSSTILWIHDRRRIEFL